jgi:hypothetical protein
MTGRNALHAHFTNLVDAGKRFPLTLAFGIAGAFAGSWQVLHEHSPHESSWVAAVLACWLCVPLSFALTLMGEARGTGRRGRALASAAVVVVALLAFWRLRALPEEIQALKFALWLAAAFAAILSVPLFARRPAARFRAFNGDLFLRGLATVAIAVPLFGGLCLALWAVQELFGLGLTEAWPAAVWFWVAGGFGVAYFAGNAPRLDAENPPGNPVFLRGLTRFLLLPLSLIYLVILYAYAARILWLRAWPEGMVSALILAFAGLGLLTHLLVQDTDGAGRWAGRRFYAVLLPLIALLFAAIARRHGEYGLTEPRALVWIAAFWLSGISLYFLFRRAARVEAIPVSLGVTALVVSLGPWSLFEMSLRSQVARLQENLAAAGRLQEGRLVKGTGPAPLRAEQEIGNGLDYLERRGALYRLRPLFAGTGGCFRCLTLEEERVPSADVLMRRLGLDAPRKLQSSRTSFHADHNTLDVRGYARAVPFSFGRLSDGAWNDPAGSDRKPGPGYRLEGAGIDTLILYHGSRRLTAISLGPLRERLHRDSALAGPEQAFPADSLRLEWSAPEGRFALQVDRIGIEYWKRAEERVSSVEGTLLIDPAGTTP